MKIVVGIDGGGTKTTLASYCNQDSSVPLAKQSGATIEKPCNIAAMTVDEALASVHEACERAQVDCDSVDSACAAVAGYSFSSRREPFKQALSGLFPNASLAIAPDYEAAFRAAFSDNRGILVIAGTGSVAFGADGTGRKHRAGGYGYKIDDAGSAYGVGRMALAAILHSLDGSGPETLLTERIRSASRAPLDWDSLIEGVYGGSIDRVAVAALSKTVAQAAIESDDISRRILMQAGGSLARLTETVYKTVFDGSGPVRIARVGGLWNAGADLTEVFDRSVRRFATDAEMESQSVDPVLGAARIAAELSDQR